MKLMTLGLIEKLIKIKEKQMKEKFIKKEKGITLISLVVTIVVLIILTAVSLNVTLGENGIITKAEEVEKEYKIANLKEQILLYLQYLQINNTQIVPEDVFNKMKNEGHIEKDAKLEGVWISTFDTKISTINPNNEVVMIDGENSGYQYGLSGEKYEYIRIIGYNGEATKDFIVPDYIDGKLVEEITGTIVSQNNVIENLKLPDSITIIDGYAFYDNSNLKTIHMPYMLEQIKNGSFGSNTSLSEIIIPNNVTIIGKNAFVNCSNVTKVILNNKLQTIGEYAFSNIKNAKESITIPSTITEIGRSAFQEFGSNNSNIKIYLPNKEITIGEYAFYNCNIEKYNIISNKNDLTTIDIEKVNNIII